MVAEVRTLGGYDLALPGLPELTPPAPLGDLEALVAGDLVQYAGRQFSFRTLVAAVIKRLRAVPCSANSSCR